LVRIGQCFLNTILNQLEVARCVFAVFRNVPLELLNHVLAGASAASQGSVGAIREFKMQKQPKLEAGIGQGHFDLCRGSLPVDGGKPSFQFAHCGIAPVVIEHAIDLIPAGIVSQFISRTLQ